MTNPTPEDKAVALAEKYCQAVWNGKGGHPEYNRFEFTPKQLTAMLADHEQQVREDERQRLAQQSGVMPTIDPSNCFTPPAPVCAADEVSEAIATMQAKVDHTDRKYRKAAGRLFETRTQLAKIKAELEQVREQTRREVLAELKNTPPSLHGSYRGGD